MHQCRSVAFLADLIGNRPVGVAETPRVRRDLVVLLSYFCQLESRVECVLPAH